MIEEEDVTQHLALGFGKVAQKLAEEEHKVLESYDKKVLVVAVTFLQLVVATLIAARWIAYGAGTTGVLARLLVEGDTQHAHGITKQEPAVGVLHVKVLLLKRDLATIGAVQ